MTHTYAAKGTASGAGTATKAPLEADRAVPCGDAGNDVSTLWESLLGSEIRMLDAGGWQTRILEAGSGEPIILLHGTGGHVEAWAKNVRELAKNFRVIAIDMVGHGLTAKPDLEYVLPDYTTHVRAVMDALGIARAHFVGLSLGAWVASWLALETPERVLRIVNCTGGVFRWPEGQDENEAAGRKRFVGTSSGLSELTLDSVRKRLHLLFHDPAKCPEELVAVRLSLYTQPGAAETIPLLHHMLAYDSPDRVTYSLTKERLQALRSPVLYLWGEFNPGGSVENAARAADLTPDGELQVIPGAGHWPQWETASQFNQSVLEYLSRDDG
ncbi:alpha/beta fold hydrolase [Arthrobacter sp. MMS18-M83]|uniref:alpha/beta fold hydrolase n=1 Tax=Arthrobacter sp. MMS18-M83 TaxID=2996261 RepID=UPI00227C13E1|nr:alpha/beta fold hydrolase [Arthrobacter sp. MMS18-M83]WAH97644.1 alpha/beta fold hydrolase [Arthrobacter sp. MMS18-M83]